MERISARTANVAKLPFSCSRCGGNDDEESPIWPSLVCVLHENGKLVNYPTLHLIITPDSLRKMIDEGFSISPPLPVTSAQSDLELEMVSIRRLTMNAIAQSVIKTKPNKIFTTNPKKNLRLIEPMQSSMFQLTSV